MRTVKVRVLPGQPSYIYSDCKYGVFIKYVNVIKQIQFTSLHADEMPTFARTKLV